MKLTTEIKQCNLGMIKSDLAWQLFFNLELTPEEIEIIKQYRLGERPLCKYTNEDDKDWWIELKDAVNGKGGIIFRDLNGIYYLRHCLLEGCERLRDLLKKHAEVRAGGGKEVYDFPLYGPNVQPAALATPPPIPQA